MILRHPFDKLVSAFRWPLLKLERLPRDKFEEGSKDDYIYKVLELTPHAVHNVRKLGKILPKRYKMERPTFVQFVNYLLYYELKKSINNPTWLIQMQADVPLL